MEKLCFSGKGGKDGSPHHRGTRGTEKSGNRAAGTVRKEGKVELKGEGAEKNPLSLSGKKKSPDSTGSRAVQQRTVPSGGKKP